MSPLTTVSLPTNLLPNPIAGADSHVICYVLTGNFDLQFEMPGPEWYLRQRSLLESTRHDLDLG